MKNATIGSKHNAGIATASSARFEIHFIYPASGVYALFACYFRVNVTFYGRVSE